MTALQAYEKFRIKLNQVSANGNISIGKGQFVEIFNEQASKWLEKEIEKTNSSDQQNDIQEFLVDNEPIDKKDSGKDRDSFSLPEDYFKYISSYSVASKEGCDVKVPLANFEVKAKNINEILKDANNEPSFEYEETPIILSSNYLIVYKTDFSVEKVFLTYYKEPGKIDISGYRNIDGTESRDVNPSFSDPVVDKVIDRCVAEVVRIYQSPESFELAQERVLED